MKSIIFIRFCFGLNSFVFCQNHSCDLIPRFMINSHYRRLKLAEIVISWLFWEVRYSNYDDRLNCFCKS